MRVLLTGASSFTGFWLAKALAEAGAEVTAICRGSPERYDPMRRARVAALGHVVRLVFDSPFGTPTFLAFLAGQAPFDVLCLHHAEVGDFRRADYRPLDAAASGTAGLAQVLERMGQRGLSRLLHTGTVFEADEGEGERPLKAVGAYGLAKTLSAHIIRHAAAEAGIPALKVVIASPFGPWQTGGFVAGLIGAWREGRPARLEWPERLRDFVPVELLARHYAELAIGRQPWPEDGRSRPSGHVETVRTFAERLAAGMRPRLGLACRLEEAPAFGPDPEPRRRHNTEPLAGLDDPAGTAARWDALAAWHFLSNGDFLTHKSIIS